MLTSKMALHWRVKGGLSKRNVNGNRRINQGLCVFEKRERYRQGGRSYSGYGSQRKRSIGSVIVMSVAVTAALLTGVAQSQELFPEEDAILSKCLEEIDILSKCIEEDDIVLGIQKIRRLFELVTFSDESEKNVYMQIFCQAAREGSLNFIKWLVEEEHVNVDMINERGNSPFTCAVFSQNIEVMEYLLDHGFPTTADSDGNGPLFMAVLIGNMKVVKYLVETVKLDPNQTNIQNLTPLTLSVKSEELLEYLLEMGGNPNIECTEGYTPFYLTYNEKVFDLFIRSGADVNYRNINDLTPLMNAAAGNGFPGFFKLLLENGADINSRDNLGLNAAFYAVHESNLEALKELVKCGIDLNVTSVYGQNIISHAAGTSIPIIEYLLEHTSYPVPYENPESGNSLLHEIVRQNNVEALEYFMGKGLDVNQLNKIGEGVLVCAIRSVATDCVEYLLKNGADPDNTSTGVPPLVYAAGNCLPEITKLLLKYGADPTVTIEGHHVIDFAAEVNCDPIIEILSRPKIQTLNKSSKLRNFIKKN